MTGKGHLIVGSAVTVATLTVADYSFSAEFAVATFIGLFAALLPDIDSPNSLLKSLIRANNQPRLIQSILGKKVPKNPLFKLIYIPLASLEMFLRAAIMFPLDLAAKLPHRGPTHYGATAALLTYLVYQLTLFLNQSPIYAIAFGAGYLSHLFADGLTRAGIPLFGPLIRQRIHLLPKFLRLRTERSISFYELLYILCIMGGSIYAALFL